MNRRKPSTFISLAFLIIFSTSDSPTVGKPSVIKTSSFGLSFESNCRSEAFKASLMFVPPVGFKFLTNSSPRFLPAASAEIGLLSIRCSSPAKLTTLNRSPSRRFLMPKSNAERAFSILPSSAIEPLVSSTKTISLLTKSFSVKLSFGDNWSRKYPSFPASR